MESKGELRRSIINLNPHIICGLCSGYFIDPVTLVECLHSFCKTCIVAYVQNSTVCPLCDVVIHKTKPFSSMRADKTLQDIVYKIVPGLYQDEINRRKKFYMTNPAKETDIVEKEFKHKLFFHQQDKFSLSIEYYDNKSGHTENRESNPNKRYLECPGSLQVCHLKKFIAKKYDLNDSSFLIDIIYNEDVIPNNYTLIDIAYNYNWRKDEPMKFSYRIFKKSKVLLKRKLHRKGDEKKKSGSASSSTSSSSSSEEMNMSASKISKSSSPSPKLQESSSSTTTTTTTTTLTTTSSTDPVVELSVNASDIKRVVNQPCSEQPTQILTICSPLPEETSRESSGSNTTSSKSPILSTIHSVLPSPSSTTSTDLTSTPNVHINGLSNGSSTLLNLHQSSSQNYKGSTNSGNQNILSAIVKNLAAKKQLQDANKSEMYSSTESITKGIPAGTTITVKTVEKSDKTTTTTTKKPCTIPLTSCLAAFNSVGSAANSDKKKTESPLNFSSVSSFQNRLSAVTSGFQNNPYDLLRPPYMSSKSMNMLKIPILGNSSPNSSSSQIPNANRLQLKMQNSLFRSETSSSSTVTTTSSIDSPKKLVLSSSSSVSSVLSSSSTSSSNLDRKSFFNGSLGNKKFATMPKTLNQSIRQIPNPSLLTNKSNNKTS